jgi:hypothetical protein
MRHIPKWLIEQEREIRKEDERKEKEAQYNADCSEDRKNFCKMWFKLDFYTPDCKLYDENKCELKK